MRTVGKSTNIVTIKCFSKADQNVQFSLVKIIVCPGQL